MITLLLWALGITGIFFLICGIGAGQGHIKIESNDERNLRLLEELRVANVIEQKIIAEKVEEERKAAIYAAIKAAGN